LKVRHGAPSATPHHYGDMGNLVADEDGNGEFTFYSNELTLIGPYSIIGRGVNVHALPDDYGLTDNYFS
jgi:Cu-Zn family superoxide dismutase